MRSTLFGLMAEAAEWAEEIGLLIAALAANQQAVTHQERNDLRYLLEQMELPLDQLEGIPIVSS